MQKLFDYAISSRKFGFNCIYVSQSYTAIPKIISHNCNYIMIFKSKIILLFWVLLYQVATNWTIAGISPKSSFETLFDNFYHSQLKNNGRWKNLLNKYFVIFLL